MTWDPGREEREARALRAWPRERIAMMAHVLSEPTLAADYDLGSESMTDAWTRFQTRPAPAKKPAPVSKPAAKPAPPVIKPAPAAVPVDLRGALAFVERSPDERRCDGCRHFTPLRCRLLAVQVPRAARCNAFIEAQR